MTADLHPQAPVSGLWVDNIFYSYALARRWFANSAARVTRRSQDDCLYAAILAACDRQSGEP